MSGGRAITVFSHARPAETDAAMRELVGDGARSGTSRCGSIPRRRASTRRSRGCGRRGRRRDRHRRGHRDRARRRRDDPARAAPLRAHQRPGLRRQLRRDRFPGDGRARATLRGASRSALAGEFETLTLPAIAIEHDGSATWAINDVAIHRRPASASPSSPTRSAAGGRPRALRRPRRRDARRLDGLQPRQRRPGAGLGRGGLRRLVHRAAFADRACARRRARRPADRPQPLGERRRRLDRRAPRGRARRGRDRDVGFLREAADLALLPGSTFYRRLRETFGRLSSSG